MNVAGKTGTTQLPFSGVAGSKDHWFVGYTPDIAGAIWLGYDKTDPDHYLTGTSSVTVATIFQEVLSKSMSELPNKEFDLSLISQKVNKRQKEAKENNENKDKNKGSDKKKDKENKKDKNEDKKKDKENKGNKDKENKGDKGKENK